MNTQEQNATDEVAAQKGPAIAGPKPIAVDISVDDVRMLTACRTSPDSYLQLILAKLKDAGAPVEGAIRLRLAHGKLFKLKDSVFEEQAAFTYMWLPEAYVHAIAAGDQVGQA
jgi:hypothetical protein